MLGGRPTCRLAGDESGTSTIGGEGLDTNTSVSLPVRVSVAGRAVGVLLGIRRSGNACDQDCDQEPGIRTSSSRIE